MTFKTGNDWYDTLPPGHKKALEGSVIYDDYYDAIIGYTQARSEHGAVTAHALVYSRAKCIECLIKEFLNQGDKATVGVVTAPADDPDPAYESARDDAIEFFDFNVAGGWVGPSTPFILADEVDPETMANMRKYVPGFVGYVERCSEASRGLVEAQYDRGSFMNFVMPPDDSDRANEELVIPMLALVRLYGTPCT